MKEVVVLIILYIHIINLKYLLKEKKYLLAFVTSIFSLIFPSFINNENKKSLIYAISTMLIIIHMRIILIITKINNHKRILEDSYLFYKYILFGENIILLKPEYKIKLKLEKKIVCNFFINFLLIDLLISFLKTMTDDIIKTYYKRIPYNVCLILTILFFQEQENIIFFIIKKHILKDKTYIYNSLFKTPWFSTNPKELWGIRWHQTFRYLYMNIIYYPIKNTIRSKISNKLSHIISIFFVFFVSGLIHEYVNFCAIHEINYFNILFFLIHGLMYILYELFPFLQSQKYNFIYIIFIILTLDLFCDPWLRYKIFLEFDILPISLFKFITKN